MGRKPSRWAHLPKGMRARPRGLKVFYYLDIGGHPRKEVPLGSDYAEAVAKWSELPLRPAQAPEPVVERHTFVSVVAAYRKDVLPGKAPRTQQDNEGELVFLLRFFGGATPAPLDEIKPVHIRQYMRWRVNEAKKAAKEKHPDLPVPDKLGQVRANREKALFSHIWNYARNEGFTDLPNPCAGIKGFRETGREAAPDDELVQRVLAEADKPLELAMRLAELTGQRPADVLRMNETDIRDGVLHVKQGKTKAKLRIVIEGELAALLDEIRAYKASVKSPCTALLVTEKGQPLTANMRQDRFYEARQRAGVEMGAFQFRDIRAKTATEADGTGGTRTAQAILGHTTEAMTAQYIRHKVGKVVRPIR